MAKKKYHQSVKDRMSESRGMERHETLRDLHADMVEKPFGDMTMRRGVVPHESGPEAKESDRYFANMPTKVVMEEYARGYGYPVDQSYYIDNVGGLDSLQEQEARKIRRSMWQPLDFGERG